MNITNTGLIDVSGRLSVGVQIGGNHPEMTVNMINSGQILTAGDLNWSFASNNTTANVNLTNTGIMLGDIVTGVGNDQLIQQAGTITGDIDLGAGNDDFVATGGTINGSVFMGADNDTAVLGGNFDPTGLVRMDGGEGTDSLSINGLVLRGFTGEDNIARGTNLVGWEKINISSGATLKLTGNLSAAQLNIDGTSTLDLKGNSPGIFTINGNVSNLGTMDFSDGAGDDVTTITGNYTGGGVIKFDTVFDDDTSATDKLIVNGNASGVTTLNINNIGGEGAQTTNGILLVQVDGTADANSFNWDIGNLQVGAYEYVLQQGSAIDPNDFYLVSAVQLEPVPVPPEPEPVPVPPESEPEPVPAPPKPVVYNPDGPAPVALWRPAISSYSVARSMNADIGFMNVSTLHQRMGDLNGLKAEQSEAWGRFTGQAVEGQGKQRFGYEQNAAGLQVGHQVWSQTGQQGQVSRLGAMVQMGHSATEATDSVRLAAGLGKDVGKIKTQTQGFGLYYTHHRADSGYADLVAQVNQLSNDFSDSYNGKASQKGTQLALSAEVGHPVMHRYGWTAEAQGQLTYLYTRYKDFADELSNIDGEGFSVLRARLGMRIHNGKQIDDKNHYYGIANLVQDIKKTSAMTVSSKTSDNSVSVNEAFDQTYFEIGVGSQYKVNADSWVYADVRYEHGLQGRKSTGTLNLGWKTSF